MNQTGRLQEQSRRTVPPPHHSGEQDPPNDLDRFSIMITHWFRSREFSRKEMCFDLDMIRTGKLGLCVDHVELGYPWIAATETAASAPFLTQKEALAIDAAVQHKDPSFH